MTKPQNKKTIPLPMSKVTEKRGRGRPRKPDAMTNAQRQAAFRARQKAITVSVTVTENKRSTSKSRDELSRENERLRADLADLQAKLRIAERERSEARSALRRPTDKRKPSIFDVWR
ncbi:hypothetical protein [Caballeronia calidae]|uniref:hypothetical protein n=1 Tax=Caballeronia calidae TaxID=1777139 RepID=UPI0012FD7515|nr:hypothetical protein [Caballeronia calidae]